MSDIKCKLLTTPYFVMLTNENDIGVMGVDKNGKKIMMNVENLSTWISCKAKFPNNPKWNDKHKNVIAFWNVDGDFFMLGSSSIYLSSFKIESKIGSSLLNNLISCFNRMNEKYYITI